MARRVLAALGAWARALIAGLCLIGSPDAVEASSGASGEQPASVRVAFPSLDRHPDGSPVSVVGHWFAQPDRDRQGAVVLLHGCGGPYNLRGELSIRSREYTALLQARGLAVLVTDSFTGRHEKELCTQRIGQRRIDQRHRRLDAWAALQWVAAQPGIDPNRIAVIGWSHGGSTVLSALDVRQAQWPGVGVLPAAAVAFYPGCSEALRQAAQPASPLLLMIGSADDWTPARPCEQWAQTLASEPVSSAREPNASREPGASRQPNAPAPVELKVYEGAFHNFDGTAPIRVRADVPNGIRPGAGVTTGGDPVARADAHRRMLDFLVKQGVIHEVR